jgi:hypothetical protein
MSTASACCGSGANRTEKTLRDVFREVSPAGLHVTRIILLASRSSLNTSEYSSLRSLITFRLSSLSIFDQHPPMSALFCSAPET